MNNSISLNTEVLKYEKSVNKDFTRCTISVCSPEVIANGTKFRKEALEKRLGDFSYIPLVGKYDKEKNDFTDHAYEIVINDEGIKEICNTVPYGVTIDGTQRFEHIKTANGEYKEYLLVDCYVWTGRYKEAECMFDGRTCNQSFEVEVLNGQYSDDGFYDIVDFSPSCLCALGVSTKPAFPDAKINYSSNDFKVLYQEMIKELNTNYDQSEVIKEMTEVTEQFEEEVVESNEEHVEETVVEEEVEVVEEQLEIEEETIEEEPVKEEDEHEEFSNEDVEDIDYKELYENLTTKYENLLEETESLREYKSTREYKDELAVKMSKINSFKTKLTEEDLLPIVENINSYSAEQIEDKCFAILGRKNIETYTKHDVQGTNKTVVLTGNHGNTATNIWDIL